MEHLKCIGCGVQLQTEDKDALGYTPPSALKKEAAICQRCFRLTHYNEIQDVSLTDEDYKAIVSVIRQKRALVVKIIDLFDFEGSWLTGIEQYIGNNPVILAGNKMDLLPKSVNPKKVSLWLKREAQAKGLNPEQIHLISAAKGHGIQNLAEEIERARKGKDVYVVGCTNTGKSTFINRLLKEFGDEGKDLLTTSHFPGTTLDLIEIPLDDRNSLFDTPGIINPQQMAHFVTATDLKMITPKKEIKPMVFQLNEKQTLFFGGLARMDYFKGGRQSFVCHFSNMLQIHRTKQENADDLYNRQLGELLSPPENADLLPPLIAHEFFIKERKTDVVISGLGWITFPEAGAKITVFAPKGVGVELRPSII